MGCALPNSWWRLEPSFFPSVPTSMAFAQTLMNIPLSMQRTYRDPQPSTSSSPMSHRRQASKPKFVGELSQCLFDFVLQLLPTQEEMALKEDVRKLLERLIRTIEPESRLLSFGSTANGFSLRNSGGDLFQPFFLAFSMSSTSRYGPMLFN